MRRDVISSALAIVVLTIGLGLVYPLAVTGVAQVTMPGRADGEARLIGRNFHDDARSFQSRPSIPSTTLGPNSRAARDAFAKNLAAYLKRERPYDPGLTAARVPVDAVTSSASGIDPQISPANAAIQAQRVAAVRHLPLARVRQLIRENTDGRSLGVFGEPGVNVYDLNRALGP